MKQLKGVEHIGIKVSNMDRSIKFYSEVLGLSLSERVKLNDQVELAFLSAGNTVVELIARPDPVPQKPGQIDHLAFTVDDINGAVAHLRAAGVECINDEPVTVLDGAKNFFFVGPDGERLELFQPKQY